MRLPDATTDKLMMLAVMVFTVVCYWITKDPVFADVMKISVLSFTAVMVTRVQWKGENGTTQNP